MLVVYRANRFNWTDTLIEKAKELRDSGFTFEQIAEQIGVGKDTIRLKLLATGAITSRPVIQEVKEEKTPSHQGPRAPLPPGSPETWGLICAYKYPIGRA